MTPRAVAGGAGRPWVAAALALLLPAAVAAIPTTPAGPLAPSGVPANPSTTAGSIPPTAAGAIPVDRSALDQGLERVPESWLLVFEEGRGGAAARAELRRRGTPAARRHAVVHRVVHVRGVSEQRLEALRDLPGLVAVGCCVGCLQILLEEPVDLVGARHQIRQ